MIVAWKVGQQVDGIGHVWSRGPGGPGWSRGDTSRLNPSSFSGFFTVIAAAKDGGVVYLEDDPASKRVLCNFSGAKCFSLQGYVQRKSFGGPNCSM